MPGAPGMLSTLSPLSASRSATCSGRHAHVLLGFFGVVPQVVFHGIHHAHVVVHQLQHVFVAGNDGHVNSLLRGAAGQRADHVVGFEAVVLEHRNAHGFERLADPGNLLQQIRRRLGAVRFVRRERLVAEGGAEAFENRHQVIGFVHRLQALHHVVEDVDGLGLNTRRGPHGRHAGARARMVGAEDEAERIDQKEARHFNHSKGCSRPRSSARVTA